MKRFSATFLVLSWVIMGFSFAFLVPAAWDWFGEDGRNWSVWTWCFLFTLATGAWLWERNRKSHGELSARDGFLLVTLVWVVLPAYAALPLMFVVNGISWTDAYFEAMSGLSATGATTLAGVDLLATSVNIWRCFLQLVGGLGIMLLAVAILPFLGLGGMQLYKAEMPGPMKEQRLTPRVAETARGLWGVYFVLSVACLLAYRAGGMSWPDAFMHMCTTVGLGGLSSHDQSFGFWNSAQLEWTAVLFMALSGISFARYFVLWQQRSLAPVAHDTEVRAYFSVMLLATVVITLMLMGSSVYPEFETALRQAAFQVVSVSTTTGYATTDYLLWPTFVPVLLLFLGCFVSCAGSTGGGIKMVRMLVLVRVAQRELLRIIHPRVVHPVALGRMAVPQDVISAVMAFMLIYGAVMVGLTLMMLATGLDVVTAFTAVIGCLNNIGPGMGKVGPAGNFGSLNEIQIWICSLAMLLGRLELLSVLVLFTPQFWRR
ncbi:TrkH family potassium uptake protein [Ottowia thiooxydans]|uniref:TrkH family potassium uptake protein n=1 Tax=Ottowia thiooxydans TaxID=219182 RepID=UPI000427B2DA|nr:potassium transporter TrkG [Ottowia thiooxydans]